jgi:hypothetical protein
LLARQHGRCGGDRQHQDEAEDSAPMAGLVHPFVQEQCEISFYFLWMESRA